MPEQGALFETPLPDPLAGMPAWMHREAGDTERAAAALVQPRTGTWRARVLEAITTAGEHGLTDWELHDALGGNLYTVAPRRKELVELGWVVDSGSRRPTNNGARAIVWVLSERARRQT